MKILIALSVIIILLLLWSVKIVFEIKLNNFDFFASVKLKFPFEKEIYNSKNPKKKKRDNGGEGKKTSGRKMNIEDLKQLKNPASTVLTKVLEILNRRCKIVEIDMVAKAALEDPMENGIAFGIISGVLNIVSVILQDKCRAGKVDLHLLSDFKSGEGLIFESRGTLRIRPFLAVFSALFNIKLLRDIKNIVGLMKREEIKNG